MSYYGAHVSRTCYSYCNISGYYVDGFSCEGLYCCGNANYRYCCSNASLDVSSLYPEKCRCPMSSCSFLSWDILLPCIAAALFVFLMITICCCQGCKRCVRCRDFIRRQWCVSTETTSTADLPTCPRTFEEGRGTGIDYTFPNLPPYEYGPPKYESIEMIEEPPKYEDIMNHEQSEGHVNCAFNAETDTPDCTVTLDHSSIDSEVSEIPNNVTSGQNPVVCQLLPGDKDNQMPSPPQSQSQLPSSNQEAGPSTDRHADQLAAETVVIMQVPEEPSSEQSTV